MLASPSPFLHSSCPLRSACIPIQSQKQPCFPCSVAWGNKGVALLYVAQQDLDDLPEDRGRYKQLLFDTDYEDAYA